jgi:hypothetical protein
MAGVLKWEQTGKWCRSSKLSRSCSGVDLQAKNCSSQLHVAHRAFPQSGYYLHFDPKETKVMPLPGANDFRVSLGEDEKDRIKRQIMTLVEASLTVGSPRT